MRYSLSLLLVIFLLLTRHSCFGQEIFTITKPVLDTTGNKLTIKYDILNSKPDEKYNVTLIVTDSKGSTIDSRTIKGDVGEEVSGGPGKKIIWDYISDNIDDEFEISIKIRVTKVPKKAESEVVVPSGSLPSQGSLILQSAAVPGLGLTRLKHKPYWLMTIPVYGLIGSSVYFKTSSNANLENYNRTSDLADREAYYDKYEQQKNISLASAIGAAVFWIADIVFVVPAYSKAKHSAGNSQKNDLFVIPELKTSYNAPSITLKYTF